jgi:peptidyl-prolyl cis-trans isomerase C
MFRHNRWLFWAHVPLAVSIALAGAAHAQLAPKPDPSPLAPGDLKRPIFDTQTPVYDAAHVQEKSASTVVAEVDGRAVTLGDVGDAIKEMPASMSAMPFADLFPGVLAQLVRQQALVIRAQQQALDEDPAVRRKVKAAADRVMANELLHQEISRTVTEQALLDRYSKEIAGKPGPVEAHVRVIMAPTEEAATGLIAELRGGADFATLAKRSSLDTTAPVGGDLGYVRLDGLNAEVGAVAFAMQPGQFAPFPVRSAGAWFVVKVEDRRQRATPPFAEVRGRLEGEMLREGVPDVVTRALAAVTMREYNINGKEVANDPNQGTH